MSNITFNEQGYVIDSGFDESARIASETGRFELSNEEIGGIVFGGSSIITRGVNVTEFLSIFITGNSNIKINKVFPNRIISQGGIVFGGYSEISNSGNAIIQAIGGGGAVLVKEEEKPTCRVLRLVVDNTKKDLEQIQEEVQIKVRLRG